MTPLSNLHNPTTNVNSAVSERIGFAPHKLDLRRRGTTVFLCGWSNEPPLSNLKSKAQQPTSRWRANQLVFEDEHAGPEEQVGENILYR